MLEGGTMEAYEAPQCVQHTSTNWGNFYLSAHGVPSDCPKLLEEVPLRV